MGKLMDDFESLSTSKEFTKKRLSELREALKDNLSDSNSKDSITIISTGSYGRGEASSESDLDYFIIYGLDNPVDEAIPAELSIIKDTINKIISKEVGDSGIFGADAAISFADMARNIGGKDDNNLSLTRRMLFLLEGTWLYGEERFKDYQKKLLKRYINKSSPMNQVAKFFLNDIIRFYRTMATDFEYKVSEDKKPWGLRNVKLRFSRKLLYFGGIIVAAEMVNLDHEHRLSRAIDLFGYPVLDRILELAKEEQKTKSILTIYNEFLSTISQQKTRDALEKVTREDREESAEYQRLRRLSKEFSFALDGWIKTHYEEDHPIHHSLVF